MTSYNKYSFSGPVTVFQGLQLPVEAVPAGYSALISAYNLKVPLPRTLYAIGKRHREFEEDGWHILTPRHGPPSSLVGHLTFAMKYEGLDLAVLKRLFEAVGSSEIEILVKKKPTGSYARRIWFLFEWVTGGRLDLPDTEKGSYVPALNPKQQWAVSGENSQRHRVRNNLPGTPAFCPLVFCTDTLKKFAEMKLFESARDITDKVPADLLARAASFLLLEDSRSSYFIEGEVSPRNRIERWARIIGEAGQRELCREELLNLQKIVIGDTRFVKLGLRDEGGFVGEHDRISRSPLPVHISARPANLYSLIEGIIIFSRCFADKIDPVIASAGIAFGFVYIHPFEDGNGRIHRYLIHHILVRSNDSPPGVVFPVSSAILDLIDDYRIVLQDYSRRLLPIIEWEPIDDGNVKVLNDTADFYRYFDATPHAEFLYECVRKTVEVDLPAGVDFLRNYDDFREQITQIVDMPDRTLDLLFRFLHQHGGNLSKRALKKEFSRLTEEEVKRIENIYTRIMT